MKSILKQLIKESFTKKQKSESTSLVDMLNETKPSTGLTKKQKSNIVKKAEAGKNIEKKGKEFKKVAAKASKEYGSKEAGQKVAAAAMWKNAAKKAK